MFICSSYLIRYQILLVLKFYEHLWSWYITIYTSIQFKKSLKLILFLEDMVLTNIPFLYIFSLKHDNNFKKIPKKNFKTIIKWNKIEKKRQNLLMTSDHLMKGKSKAYIKEWACSRANEQIIKAYIINYAY